MVSISLKIAQFISFLVRYWFKIERVNNNWQATKIINHEYSFQVIDFNINNIGKLLKPIRNGLICAEHHLW